MQNVSRSNEDTCKGIDAISLIVLDAVDGRHKFLSKQICCCASAYPVLDQYCGSGIGYAGLCCLAQIFILHAKCKKEHPTKLTLVAINLISSHLQLTSEGSLCQIVQMNRLQELLWSAEGSPFFLETLNRIPVCTFPKTVDSVMHLPLQKNWH